MTANLKPVDNDVHLKYICQTCGQAHWISFLEASTKGFKIVCFCGKVFGVKRPKKIKIIYGKRIPKTVTKPETTETKEIKPIQINDISDDLLNKSMAVLLSYGFTKTESIEYLKQSYATNPLTEPSELVKQTLLLMRNE